MIALRPGERLVPGQEVRTDGMVLTYQGDGNLVLYDRGRPVWASDTFSAPGFVEMQGDGNLVIYTGFNTPVWGIEHYVPGGQLELTRAGLKVIAPTVIWQTPPFASQPGPTPVPIRIVTPTVLDNRAVRDDVGHQLHVGPSRFYWRWAMKADPDRVLREMDSDVASGATFARVLAQVGSLDTNDYWAGRVANQNDPDHEELTARLLSEAGDRGLRIALCLIGKGNGMERQSTRRAYIERMASVVRDRREAVLFAQVMNEPYADNYCSDEDVVELEQILRQASGGLVITSTGSNEGHAFGQVGTPHLDRDQSKSEMQDRPWRQPWDTGLLGHAWCNDEPIGPGSSVAEETRGTVLRSHAAVTFMAGGFAYVYHADPGIRGNGDLASTPGYRETPAALRFLPGHLPNGSPQNANTNFPNRHWTLEDTYIRAANANGRGIVRAYGRQLDGVQWTVPFGPVTDYELRAERALEVECYQQDVNDRLWVRQVGAGERVRFSAQHPDYLLKSRAL